jgi:hypothetical protein
MTLCSSLPEEAGCEDNETEENGVSAANVGDRGNSPDILGLLLASSVISSSP